MEAIGLIWNEAIVRPMLNSLVFLYAILFNNFGIAIMAFTIIIRGLTIPLTVRQARQTRLMAGIQPKLKQLQEKHSKDRQKLSQETMRLYRSSGVSPIGCLGPLVIQMPIWIGLFQALRETLPTTPDAIISLSQKLYSWLPAVHSAVPLSNQFAWLNLAEPDPTPILPILVGVTTWLQQKMVTVPSGDPRQASTNNILLWMMPIMLAVFAFGFPSGLALYWTISNIVGCVIQYFITGWTPLFGGRGGAAATQASLPDIDSKAEIAEDNHTHTLPEEDQKNGDEGNLRKDRRRGSRSSSKGAQRRTRRG